MINLNKLLLLFLSFVAISQGTIHSMDLEEISSHCVYPLTSTIDYFYAEEPYVCYLGNNTLSSITRFKNDQHY